MNYMNNGQLTLSYIPLLVYEVHQIRVVLETEFWVIFRETADCSNLAPPVFMLSTHLSCQ